MKARPRRMWGTKEVASCMQVMRVLQSYLDGHTDEVTARRVAKHLDACRRCGLEATTYRKIKAALARQATRLEEATLDRLKAFGASVASRSDSHPETGPEPGAPPA